MIISTKALVLKHFKYSENSIICKVYTEKYGLKSYIINNPYTKKAKFRIALFQPLMLLDIVAYNKDNKSLQHLKEASVANSMGNLHQNIYKSSIALFTAELLFKVIKEEEANETLYYFIQEFILLLDKATVHYADYHLLFIIHLTQYLGFYPIANTYLPHSYFDMIEGHFTLRRPLHNSYLDIPEALQLHRLLLEDYDNAPQLNLNGKLRNQLLEKILMYYKIHLEGMGELHSLEVLRTVFEEG